MNKRTLKINDNGTILKIVSEGVHGKKTPLETVSIYMVNNVLKIYTQKYGMIEIPCKEA